MALNAYLRLKGQRSGEIKGSVTQRGREGKIMVIAVSHSVVSPREAGSGQATGRRMHKPLVITKELDKSSPLLYKAFADNELLTEFELQFWQPSATGTEKQHYTIRLTNAQIAAIDFRMLNNKHPDLASYAEYEEVAFTYQKITWTWNDGGITADDVWEIPVA